jgi:cellulose biosynthesis protein BcsQ
MTTQPPGGKIVTFYSYKGGAGRTMALANVAWILAANGNRVLVVDWDLEAPGLHRYFLPFLEDPNLKQTSGIIEMVSDYLSLMTETQSNRPPGVQEASSVVDPRRYAAAIQFGFECDGALHLLGAGRHDDKYADRIRGLDWQKFYVSFGGSDFIRFFAEKTRAEYDYILIDSRTGVADVAGICTMELPDQVVICFTYNRQSVEGASAVAQSVATYAQAHERSISLLPLPTRVVPDIEGVHEARDFAQAALRPFLPQLVDREALLTYWGSAEIPHYPAYGFEETLATFRERAGGRNNLLADMEWLTGQICRARGTITLPRMKREIRERYLHRFRLRDPRRAALDEALAAEPAIAFRRIRSMVAEPLNYGEAEWRFDLASALERVATTLSESGAHDDGLAATEEEIAIRRELAAKAPDAYQPALASALNNLANRLSAVGQRQEALAPAQEAVAIRRELAAKVPDAYRPDLAMALNNLTIRLSEVGQRREALAPAQEAVAIRRELAAKAPDAYRPDLAIALNTLANILSEVGQCEAALAPAQEAVAIRRELAAKAPDAYRPALASALNNLANRLGEVGRRQEALAPAQEHA